MAKHTDGRCYFIVSCARSGSTSLSNILNTAKNGICATEPTPNLNYETRELMDGRLSDSAAVIASTVLPRVREMLAKNEIYGEKNVTYGPFIPYLYEALKCKFVFLKRDGRDVVTSLINWHDKKFGSIYRECKETGNLSEMAIRAAAGLPVHLDTSDYARPRPPRADVLYGQWEDLTRAEMCAYYWSVINELYLDKLRQLPEDAWITVDYTSPSAEDLEKVAEFCGLKGLDKTGIERMLFQKINSLQDRGALAGVPYPGWKNWDSGMRRRFDRLASKTMYRLGYYQQDGAHWRPAGYGDWWRAHTGGLEWYTWMYNSRRKMHEDLVHWVHQKEREGEEVRSIADFGCGLGVGYCDDFAAKRYIGVDISEKNTQWCKENRKNPRHAYYAMDFIAQPLQEGTDLVFSSGTIDNGYDFDAFLASMVHSSRKWIYLTLYRGWFPDLKEHKYQWSDEHRCFYTNGSPQRIRETLTQLGCTEIVIEPMPAGRQDIPFETRVIARVPGETK